MKQSIDLNHLTDEEIVDLLFSLPFTKLATVMSAISSVLESFQARGQVIAKRVDRQRFADYLGGLEE